MTTRPTGSASPGVVGAAPGASGGFPFSTAILIVILGFAVVITFSQLSRTGQWILGLLVVATLAVVAAYAVSRRTRRPEPLDARSGQREVVSGELANLTDLVGRANRGLAFSQDVLVTRVRGALLERIRLRRGLPPESTASLESGEDAIREIVDDPTVLGFLLATQDREARARWVAGAQRDPGITPALMQILSHVEA